MNKEVLDSILPTMDINDIVELSFYLSVFMR